MRLLLVAEQLGENGAYLRAVQFADWQLVAEVCYTQLDQTIPGLLADASVLVCSQVDDAVLGATVQCIENLVFFVHEINDGRCNPRTFVIQLSQDFKAGDVGERPG